MQARTRTRDCLHCKKSFQSYFETFEIKGQMMTLGEESCEECRLANEAKQEARKHPTTEPIADKWLTICPPGYQGFNLDLLPKEGRSIAKRVLAWSPGSKGFGLMGPSRTGKTFLLYELFRQWYGHGKKICITTGTEFAWACGNVEQADRRELMERMIRADMLMIDDLDKSKITGRVESDLYHVCEQRRRYERPVFVSVNSSSDELAGKMSGDGAAPIINRLSQDLCEFIDLNINLKEH